MLKFSSAGLGLKVYFILLLFRSAVAQSPGQLPVMDMRLNVKQCMAFADSSRAVLAIQIRTSDGSLHAVQQLQNAVKITSGLTSSITRLTPHWVSFSDTDYQLRDYFTRSEGVFEFSAIHYDAAPFIRLGGDEWQTILELEVCYKTPLFVEKPFAWHKGTPYFNIRAVSDVTHRSYTIHRTSEAPEAIELCQAQAISVKLVQLEADRAVDGVTIRWAVVQESEVYGYQVLRWVNDPALSMQEVDRFVYACSAGDGRREYIVVDRPDDTNVQYNYTLQIIDLQGRKFDLPVASRAAPVIHADLSLRINPNPLSQRAHIHFSLATAGLVQLSVYNLLGRLVHIICHGQYTAGEHEIVWSAEDENGMLLPRGPYFFILSIGSKKIAQTALLLD
jgi:hypothetical protein